MESRIASCTASTSSASAALPASASPPARTCHAPTSDYAHRCGAGLRTGRNSDPVPAGPVPCRPSAWSRLARRKRNGTAGSLRVRCVRACARARACMIWGRLCTWSSEAAALLRLRLRPGLSFSALDVMRDGGSRSANDLARWPDQAAVRAVDTVCACEYRRAHRRVSVRVCAGACVRVLVCVRASVRVRACMRVCVCEGGNDSCACERAQACVRPSRAFTEVQRMH